MVERALVELSAVEMLAGFAARRFTPNDLLEACLNRIARINPLINAVTAMDIERAKTEADAATRRWRDGTPKGLLDGLPIGVKDLQETEGLLTTYGSRRYKNNIPTKDLPMVARLRQAGAIVLAKTNVPEMGAGGNTRNPVWGASGNPFDPRLIVGGSSGGSAAALAADLLPLCTGSDTGGSLRLPASICGVVGFRPSVDVIAHPTRPLGWSAISVLGPMARSMDDLVLMLRACHAHDPDDPLSSRYDAGRFDTLPETSLSRLRIGVSEDFGGAPVDPDIRRVFRARVAALAPHVGECRPVDMNLGAMDRVFDILRAESFLAAFETALQNAPEDFGEAIHDNIALGQGMSLSDRAWAHAEQTRILRTFNRRMGEFDLIMTPTVPVSPFPWTQAHAPSIDGTRMDIYYRWLALTYRGSLTGGPAITLPSGRDSNLMPFGLQFLGPVKGDPALLSAARAIETLLLKDSATARPRPNLDAVTPPPVGLRSMVTHPPAANAATVAEASVQTAV